MNSEFIPFEPEHFQMIELSEQERKRFDADPYLAQRVQALSSAKSGGTLRIGWVIIAIIGYLEVWPGKLMLWSIPSIHVKRYAMVYLKTAKRYLQILEQVLQPSRIEASTVDDEVHNRWMRFLGFRNETPEGMKNYSTLNETFNMWSIIYDRN